MSNYLQEAEELFDMLKTWRRDFHRFPELRFEEHRTSEKVSQILEELGLEVQTGVGKTGVVGLLRGGRPGKVVLLRSDMDALPIIEETGLEYSSQNEGVMHACGHDSHMAMGLGVASILAKQRHQLPGTVKFAFQPAEEGAGGALAMIEDGVLENPSPDYSFGVHVDSQRPLSQVSIGEGPILASADAFKITVKGRGGHGALPEQTTDALMAGVQIVNMLQTISSRNLGLADAAVISVCSFNAGNTFNVIPGTAEISGTIRTYEQDIQDFIHRRMKEISSGVAQSLGATAEVEIDTIVPAAVNDPAVTAVVRRLAADLYGADNIELDYRVSPSDDMAEFLKAAPGCHVIIGAALPENFPHHNKRFNIDETAMIKGTALLTSAIVHFLSAE